MQRSTDHDHCYTDHSVVRIAVIMNTLNIIFLSCAVAVTVAQKVGDTSNDIIDGQRRSTGGYGLLRPGLQGGYNQGGYNQGGYNQGGYNQGGYNQGGYNQGGYNQGYNGYKGGYGGAPGGFGQGYGGNQGYGGGAPGFGGYPGAGHGGYPNGFGGTGGYGGGVGGYPSRFGQGLSGYGGYRPNPYKPGFDPNKREHYYETNGFPELEVPSKNQYTHFGDRPVITAYDYHTGIYPAALGERYRFSDNLSRYLGRKAGEIKQGEEMS